MDCLVFKDSYSLCQNFCQVMKKDTFAENEKQKVVKVSEDK